ncbi:MAG: MFS transporter [Legionellales bacterium]|nr:MAG: MFS transporter [Legionellales bacterium]
MPEKNKSLLSKAYPCIIIFLCALFLSYKYILQVFPSIMTTDLMRQFNISGVGLGNLAATFFYSYLVTQFFVGVLVDKYGCRVLASVAITISAVGAYGFYLSDFLWEAEVSRSLMGVGAAFATVVYMKIAAQWFSIRVFALVAGLLLTAVMLGAIFGQAPLSLIVQHVGWRGGVLACAILGFLIAITFFVVVRDKNTYNTNENIDVPAHTIKLKDIVAILSKPQNWLLALYSGLTFSPIAVFGGLWGNPFLNEEYSFSTTTSASYIAFAFVGLAFGGPILGMLSDKFNKRRLFMAIGAIFSLLSILPVIYMKLPLFALGTCLFTFGFFTGAFMLGFSVGKEINPAILTATVIALINTGDAVMGAVTEPLVGKILDLSWQHQIVNGVHYFSIANYHSALSLLPMYIFSSLVVLYFIKEKKQEI